MFSSTDAGGDDSPRTVVLRRTSFSQRWHDIDNQRVLAYKREINVFDGFPRRHRYVISIGAYPILTHTRR
jgi:hypothetical protein